MKNPFAGSNRKRGLDLTLGAMVASLAIAAPAPPAVAPGPIPVASSSREALPPLEKRRAPPKPGAKKPKRDAPKGAWTFYRDGAIDPVGTFHSYRSLRRVILARGASGRQWVKFRKRLRREMPRLAAMTVPQMVAAVLARRGAA